MSPRGPDVWLRAILEVVSAAGDDGHTIEQIEDEVGRLVRSAEAAQVESFVKVAEDRGWVEPVDGSDKLRLSTTGRALLSGIRSRHSELADAGEAVVADTAAVETATTRAQTTR
jgi:hypothetical protein